jgi:hypothetical protein
MVVMIEQYHFDDDASFSSTLTVEMLVKASTSPPERSSKRVVTFDLEHNEEYPTQVDEQDLQQAWYSAADYAHFRQQTAILATEIIRAESRISAPLSYERVLMRTYEACCRTREETDVSVLGPHERRHLNRWCDVAPSRLGLEKWTMREIATDRSHRRRAIRALVIDLQSMMLEDAEEYIRLRCETISRSARLYSRTLAQSQAYVLEKEEYSWRHAYQTTVNYVV